MKILVVEDEHKIARFVQKGLKEFGFAVDVIGRGDEALEIILDNPFDAIVLDIMLPGRDGLSILRALRERSNAIPVLILTARGRSARRSRDSIWVRMITWPNPLPSRNWRPVCVR